MLSSKIVTVFLHQRLATGISRVNDMPARADGQDDLPVSQEREIDRLCTQFEQAWRDGHQPRIEDYLDNVGSPVRDALLKELIAAEVDLRHEVGEDMQIEEYHRRFPDDRTCVRLGWRVVANRFSNIDSSMELDPTLSYCVRGADGTLSFATSQEDRRRLESAFSDGLLVNERYLLLHRLGQGGMGVVYLAHDQHLDRAVAIKAISPPSSAHGRDDVWDENLKAMFHTEARLGASLIHPHIATVFDFGIFRGQPFTVFEYVPGLTLMQALGRRGRYSIDEVQAIIGALALALDFAHERGVVHRDLKPSNIKATQQGQFKLLDLGLAREFRQMQDWTFAGTPAYASPEQVGELPCDGRTDQYALALIMYELLAGRRVFESHSPRALLEMHRNAAPADPREHSPSIPETVAAAILKALSKEPGDRFVSCRNFATAVGCQLFLSSPANPGISLAARVNPERRTTPQWWNLWSGIAAFLGRYLNNYYMAITDGEIWINKRGQLYRYSMASLRDATYDEDRPWVLCLALEVANKKEQYAFSLPGRSGSIRWYEHLRQAIYKYKLLSAGRRTDPRSRHSVAVSRNPPDVSSQVLGPVNATGRRREEARDAIEVQAAILGGDGIVNFVEERAQEPESTKWRCSGVAVKATEFEGKTAFRQRQFAAQVRRLCLPLFPICLVLSPLMAFIVLGAQGPLAHAEEMENVRNSWIVLASVFPVGLVALLSWLCWPQLVRPTVITTGALVIGPWGFIIVVAVCNLKHLNQPAPVAAVVIAVLLSCSAFSIFGLRLVAQIWREHRRFTKGFKHVEVRRSSVRRSMGVVVMFTAMVFSVTTVLGSVLAGIQTRIEEPEIPIRKAPSPNELRAASRDLDAAKKLIAKRGDLERAKYLLWNIIISNKELPNKDEAKLLLRELESQPSSPRIQAGR